MTPSPAVIGALKPDEIFVFGSNLAGRHGKGAALQAKQKYGAIQGQGSGFQGQCYAIPTKDHRLRTLPLDVIITYTSMFLWQAKYNNPGLIFLVTQVGCGLAGYTPEEMAPLFRDPPDNVLLPQEFITVLESRHHPDPQ